MRCEDCKYWERRIIKYVKHHYEDNFVERRNIPSEFGICTHDCFDRSCTTNDGVSCENAYTGQNFGCKHFERKS